MSKRKILFVLGSLGAGGAERQVLRILTHLDRERYEPLLYVVYREGDLVDMVPSDVPVFAYWDDRPFPRINFPGRILLSQSRHLAKIIRSEGVDLVYDRASQMTLMTSLAMKGLKIPRLSVAVGEPSRDFSLLHSQFAIAKRFLLRRAYRTATRVVAVSEGVREGLIDFFSLPPAQVVTCPNLFDIDRIDRSANEPFGEYDSDRFEIVSVGRLSQEKGQLDLLKAVDQLVNKNQLLQVRLWLVGDGPMEQQLREFVTAHKLDQHVTFAGYQANPLPFVKHAQLFCLPSLYEGMPNALVEAMVCQTPAIATDCRSGPREILGDNGERGILVPVSDSNALASAIRDVVMDRESAIAKTDAARQHIIDTYSLDRGMSRLEALFNQVFDDAH